MADRRKLQLEIDRTMKKIDEGMEVFERTFQKVENAETKEHKEKYDNIPRFRDLDKEQVLGDLRL